MKTMYTYLLATTFIFINFAKTTETQVTQQPLTEKLWQWAQQAYQYVQENPQTVEELKKQFLSGQRNNYTQADKDALYAKLRAKWQQSGTDKSFEEWLEEKAALNV